MGQAGFDDAIHERLVNNEIVYAGYSAGACVTGPDLDGCHLMDDPDSLPDGYASGGTPTPLGWIPWRIVPHFRSDHPEAELADLAVKHLIDASLPFQTLRDGQAFVIDGERNFLT
jgi:dipeptidase E